MNGLSSVLLSWIIIALLAYLWIKIIPKRDIQEEFELENFDDEVQTSKTPRTVTKFELPPAKDGVIVLSNMGTSLIRDISIELSKHGYHLLIGGQSEVDQAIFSGRKGLEFTNFNLYDPSTFPDLIYRLRIIERDLSRPLTGLVIDLSSYLETVYDMKPVDLLEMKSIENVYKAAFASPVKCILALFDLIKHQSLARAQKSSSSSEDNYDYEEEGGEAGRSSTTSIGGTKSFNANGFRIVLVVKDYYPQRSCQLHCLLQRALVDYVHLLSRSSLATNFSVSVIPVRFQKAETSSRSSQGPVIPWELDLASEDEEEEEEEEGPSEETSYPTDSLEEATKSLLHALISRSPFSEYPAGLSSILPPVSLKRSSPASGTRNNHNNKRKNNNNKKKNKPYNPYERYQRPPRNSRTSTSSSK